jgi:hypothetical protein
VRFEVLMAVTEDYCLLGCDNMSSGRRLPCLKRVVLIPHCHMVKSAGSFKINILGVLVYTSSPCGGRLGYLHCSPAVVEGNEKNPVPVTLSLGDINTETWPFRLGVGCKADDLAL